MTAAARTHSCAARHDERQSASGHQPLPKRRAPAAKRLEARASAEIYEYLEHASAVSGRSLTDLILAGALREAHDVIERAHVLRLSSKSQIRFAEALMNPPAPNSALLKATEAYDKLVVSDS